MNRIEEREESKMTEITIDSVTRDQLRDAHETVRLVDEEGRILGTFKPVDVPPYDPDLIPPPLSDEEIARRIAEPGGLTTSEVLKQLQDL